MTLNQSYHSSKLLKTASIALILGFCGSFAYGQNTPSQAAQPDFTWGGDVRLRNEFFNNAVTLNSSAALHEQDYFRTRARLWFTEKFSQDASFNFRAAVEPRTWMNKAFVKQHPGTGTEWRYGIIDTLNFKWTSEVAGNPLTITAGRQDIQLADPGSSWLVFDGTPGDGSWTSCFDAVRASLDLKQSKTKVEFAFIDNQALPGDRLPILGSKSTYSLAEQDEQGVILNLKNTSIADMTAEGYFIYKSDRKILASGDNADIYTIGGKITEQVSPNFQYYVDVAYQFGSKQDSSVKNPVLANASRRDISAYGILSKATYSLKDAVNNQFSFGAEVLSGDKAGSTGKDEMFDILWGRFPRFSEVYAYTPIVETGGKIAQANNLIRLSPSWSVSPAKSTSLSFTYSLMLADKALPTRATNASAFTGTGHLRGNIFQFIVRHQFTKKLSGLAWFEVMKQGNFYVKKETLSFMRFELAYTF